MKLLRSGPAGYTFQLQAPEKALLDQLLALYPVAAAARPRPAGADPALAESRRLLDEALAAHREEQRRQLRALFESAEHVQQTKTGWRLQLAAPQLESLLQALNDVRVGQWVELGSPDFERGEKVTLTEENGRRLWLMEMAAYFEHQLLEALGEA